MRLVLATNYVHANFLVNWVHFFLHTHYGPMLLCSLCPLDNVLGGGRLTSSVGGGHQSCPAAHKYDANGECTVCHAKKDDVENAEARIGTKYFETLTKAIESLKDVENKTATINILKNSVKLGDLKGILGSNNSTYNITFVGNGNDKTTIDVSTDNEGEGNHQNYIEGANLSFKNATVKLGDSSNYQGFVRAGRLSFEDCRFFGMGCYWGTENYFTRCVFDDGNSENKDFYHAWLYNEGKYIFEDCTFETKNGKFLHLYNENVVNLDVELKGCTFKCPSDAKYKKAALNIKRQVKGSVVIDDVTLEDVDKSFDVETGASTTELVVKIDGEQVFPKN